MRQSKKATWEGKMIDELFKKRMKKLLSEEYDGFISAIENEDAVRGVRVNTLKCSTADYLRLCGETPDPISYTKCGFIPKNADGIGATPEHHAGMIYVQDPGAMATLSALDIKEGWRVLDMCAAPGGKSGQAAAEIGKDGFILSNEYVPKRAKIVVSNFERLGITNAIVTSLDTAELPKLYSDFFDLVIADVPCSGEGMFRKSSEAIEEWSEENVRACAVRQMEIIKNAAPLVASGGYLVYSTCTYSVEENEAVIDEFLSEHPEFSLVPVRDELRAVTADGVELGGRQTPLTRRFYPHKSRGEGQFIALMRKTELPSKKATILYKDASKPLSRSDLDTVEKFFKEALCTPPEGRLIKVGDNIVLSTHGVPIPPRSVFSAGVLVGKVEKNMLFPSHQFFSAFGGLFKRQENLSRSDGRITRYLRGEEIEAANVTESGFCSVLYEGVPLGGGKQSGGRIKNHYPKGLRNK